MSLLSSLLPDDKDAHRGGGLLHRLLAAIQRVLGEESSDDEKVDDDDKDTNGKSRSLGSAAKALSG